MANSPRNAAAKDQETAEPTTAVAIRNFTNDELLNIGTFEDAIALMTEVYGDVLTADSVLGNGFRLLTNKRLLVGVPFAALQWKFLPGDFGSEYTNILIVTQDGNRYLVNDGGVGITPQLREFSEKTGRTGGLVMRHGLSVSDYTFTNDAGVESPATTFYLDLTA